MRDGLEKPSLSGSDGLGKPSLSAKLSMKKNVIPPTQARDSQTLPRVVPRAAPSGQPSVKSDCPSLGLEVYTKLHGKSKCMEEWNSTLS